MLVQQELEMSLEEMDGTEVTEDEGNSKFFGHFYFHQKTSDVFINSINNSFNVSIWRTTVNRHLIIEF